MDSETDTNVKILGTYKEYYELVNKRFEYLQKLLFNLKMEKLSMLLKEREFFQYKPLDLVYISPLTCQLKTSSRKVYLKFVRPREVYKGVDPKLFLLCTLDGKLLLGPLDMRY